ncbi:MULTISPECIES: NAD-dependent epimerase/dehydratase family protein [Microcystis]|jgi:CDP-paratose 2-epimerase|uniref:NAD-dependent epimerase/dehydratase family protein n=2 Tax=Microcystis TaxID=1125 RepID=A0A857D6M8_MICAE|nr:MULTISPECIES: NAD-dependent epimerase/dehydratase family protein [Microcystis]MCA6385536.1 GDP-mannose 4,6-dehydratase [Cytophagales bacterium]TRU98073.1 MAG: NAD-dependent epimerase/dehydratase family protein [Microcystis wesenbergii Mw_QC_S_20081001_S30]TRV00918.1 MAG: NAD-dependent epimerase/dehydratase family protein [Microcystis wesenbergii Mw_QC_S_20081001_S30D]MCA2673368.1 GDP-mannose 4,6-dehydratase [Microcystis sp. M080S2]MCA2732999.1 GDP-mannose 4,6-dehydratase [Microcystis sp. M1
MKYLITGGCGFLGSNIAAQILKEGEELLVFDNLYRSGSEQNLNWLRTQGQFQFAHGDIRNTNDVNLTIKEFKPDVIFHLAGQVAMTTSIANPRMDFEINALGTLNVLEAVRQHSPDSVIVYSSTNKVYGDLEQWEYQEREKRYFCPDHPQGFDESIPLDFHSPYGCSKGAGDQYMLDYARIFALRTVVFRHSSIYGGRQFSTYDQGWIGWFCQKALEAKANHQAEPFTISGSGKQVRDVLYASDAIACYLAAVEHIDNVKGEVFNIGGGVENSLSLLELFDILEELTGAKLNYQKIPVRQSDQRIFIADISKATTQLQWKPKVSSREGVSKMLNWLSNQ